MKHLVPKKWAKWGSYGFEQFLHINTTNKYAKHSKVTRYLSFSGHTMGENGILLYFFNILTLADNF